MSSPENQFCFAVFRLIDTLFAETDYQNKDEANYWIDFITLDKDIYRFHFNRKTQRSDSLHEIVEVAIRTVEKEITSRLIPGELPYTVVALGTASDEEFRECFTVLERPERVEMYTDTFRKGVAVLRKMYRVA